MNIVISSDSWSTVTADCWFTNASVRQAYRSIRTDKFLTRDTRRRQIKLEALEERTPQPRQVI